MPTQMFECMLDLETVGVRPGCAILSIGAVMFDIAAGKTGEEFYQAIDVNSCVNFGLRQEPATAAWWANQNVDARKVWEDPDRLSLDESLNKFSKWLAEQCDSKVIKIWGNGASFDQPILVAAYDAIGTRVPWIFKNEMCYRTMNRFLPTVIMEESDGVLHNALDDARFQTAKLLKMFAARDAEQPKTPKPSPLEVKFATPPETVMARAKAAVAKMTNREINRRR